MAEITSITALELHTPCEEPESGRRISFGAPSEGGGGRMPELEPRLCHQPPL